MMRGIATVLAFISTVLFPWQFTALLALGLSIFEPLVPLAVGLFADTLYYAPHTGALPVCTISGAVVTVLAFFVRSQLKTSIIGE